MERPSQPYATVTEHDHTAWIYIAAILGIVYSLIFCGIRVVARRSTGRSFGTDEAALLVGTVSRGHTFSKVCTKRTVQLETLANDSATQCIAVIQSITTIIAGNDGLGKSWDLVIPSLQGRIQKVIEAMGKSKVTRTDRKLIRCTMLLTSCSFYRLAFPRQASRFSSEH